MNIPQPRQDGWTPSYLVELRQVADGLISHVDTNITKWLTLEEWRAMLKATENERQIFTYYAAEYYGSAALSPEIWLNHRVAERCYEAAKARFARGVVASNSWLPDVCLWCGRISGSHCERCRNEQ